MDEKLEGCVEDDGGSSSKEYIPHIGMEFESEEAAFAFFNEYGRIMGFGVRRDYHTKSKKDGIIINRKFVCCKEGKRGKDKRDWRTKEHRAETRTNCKAFMYISFNRKCAKWFVKKFDGIHNHPLHIPQCSHMMPSQKNLCEARGINIDLAADTGISLKTSHDLISAQAGGRENVGFTQEDQKHCLHEKRQRDLQCGEAENLLRYFKRQAAENPSFYNGKGNDEDPKSVISERYMHICSKMVKLAVLACQHEGAYHLVDDSINDLCVKVNKMVISQHDSGACSSGVNVEVGNKGLDAVDPNLSEISMGNDEAARK